ncbi:uncharacterized protein TNCV_2180051 [Trichonephila clavipes]|uniref:DUF4817 domain-containing protein n=1 Tax=Trichonephila clavipes TaxID=2585209 RepID=A0A8X7B943_TRICX|nr:uncharacterized protein TNCV_2180051 [Trichonephila clavipes]
MYRISYGHRMPSFAKKQNLQSVPNAWRTGPLTAKNLRLIITKFEETGSLNVRSGRGRKPVSKEAIEKVALQVEEGKASNVQASTSVRRVAEALDLNRSTVQKIM